MVWSITCFLKGLWIEKYENTSTTYLLFGSFLGALVFGCRPPIALANIIVVAVLYQLFKDKNDSSGEIVKKAVCVIVPFLIVGVLEGYIVVYLLLFVIPQHIQVMILFESY